MKNSRRPWNSSRAARCKSFNRKKMASIGQLAAGVAHEINNPTGFVSSNLKILNDNVVDIFRLVDQYRQFSKHVLQNGAKNSTEDEQTISLLAALSDTEQKIDIDYLVKISRIDHGIKGGHGSNSENRHGFEGFHPSRR